MDALSEQVRRDEYPLTRDRKKSYVRISSGNLNGLQPPVAKFALQNVSAARPLFILSMLNYCNVIPASVRYMLTPNYDRCAFASLADLRDRLPVFVLNAGFKPHYLAPPAPRSPAPSPVDSMISSLPSVYGAACAFTV